MTGGERATATAATSVAVVIPAHRASPELERCLEAVGRLDPAPDEVIVVVDGGDPDVVARSEAVGATTVVLEPSGGPGAARNRGVASVTSDVVLFLDSDVEAAPDVVGRVASTFAERPAVAAVIGSYDDAPAATNVASQYKNLLNHHTHQRARTEGFTFWGACGAVRTEVFRVLGGFDEDYVAPSIEDIELGYRMRAAGQRILVDKDLQVTHLKRWTPRSLLKTDVVHRALPWSALILRTRRMENDLNVDTAGRIKALLVLLVPVLLVGAFRWPLLALAVPLALGAVVAADAPLLRLLARRGGPALAAWGAAWHLLYHLYAAVGFLAAVARHLIFGAQPVSQPWVGSPRRRRDDAASGPRTEDPAGLRVSPATMDRQSRRIRAWVPVALFVAVGLVLLPTFRDAVHTEGLAPLRMAQLYADGEWSRAVNPYWGPLYSWLLAPLLRLGIEPLLATKLLQLGIGAATLLAVRRLCIACDVRTATADGMALATIPLVLYLSFVTVQVDLLAALLLLLFAGEVVPTGAEGRTARLVRAGVWGGLAYLARAYSLPVVVASVVVVAAWRGWEDHRVGRGLPWRRAATRAATTLAVVALVVGPWVAVLTADAGSLTLTASAGYDLSDARSEADGQPGARGLVEPPYDGALFAWEQPGSLPEADGGDGIGAARADPTLERLVDNVRDGAAALASRFWPVLVLAAVGAVTALRRPGPTVLTPLAALVVVVAVYLSGYVVVPVEGRYLWFTVLALLPMAAAAIDLPFLRPSLERGQPGYASRRLAGFVIFAVLLSVQGAVALEWETDGRQVASVARDVRAAEPEVTLDGARVASVDRWGSSSVLCLHLGCTYLGRSTGVEAAEVAGSVDYVLDWADPAVSSPDPIDHWPVVVEVDGLVVRRAGP